MRDLILGTAGHIDHGKTRLVRALTGTDCDRLPEEKARGITIDIGFARLDLGDYQLGIVDVPGHERFIKNMLAGATGIDLALLVVAADDAVMPQTREHVEILSYLGLRAGVIALTKCDAVDADGRALATLEVRELVADTFLADAAIVETSAQTGAGLDDLRRALAMACERVPPEETNRPFRLAIDRAFAVAGVGAVVTGSVTSGSIRVGDELDWWPSGERLRVRGLQQHDRTTDRIHRGQRAAINLAGVEHTRLHRGQELAAVGSLVPGRVLTVQLQTGADSPRPIKHRLPVRLHLGTAESMATVALLDADALKPGEAGLAQLFLDEPAVAAWGQPFVLRDVGAERTLGGGRVLQPVAHKLRRRHTDDIERAERLRSDEAATRAEAVAGFGSLAGVTVADLERGAGLAPEAAATELAALTGAGTLVAIVLPHGRSLLLHATALADFEERLLDAAAAMHAEAPLLTSLDRAKVAARFDYLANEPLVQSVLDRLITRRALLGDARRVARTDFQPLLSANQRKLKGAIVEAHRIAQFQPPVPASFATQAGGHAGKLPEIFAVAVAEGLLVKVSDEIYLHADVERHMRALVSAKLASVPTGLTVADLRDTLATTRKYAVPLCEYLDRTGVTRRLGDYRVAP